MTVFSIRRASAALVLLLCLSCAPALRAACAVDGVVTVGVVPQQAASDLAQGWIPLLREVSAVSGCEFRFATAPTITEFERRLARGEYAIAYMNPYHYVVFHQAAGYQAFAREKDRKLRGLIVVRNDSAIASVQELDGKEVAFPSPAAFAATVIPLAELKRGGISVKPRFVASHDSVYLNVARGLVVAGGGIERTLEAIDASVRDRMRVIWRSAEYPPHAFARLPGVPESVGRDFVDAMQKVAASAPGADLLKQIGFKGVVSAQDRDWEPIRALDIRVLDALLAEPAR
ncbi:PhnD/SsuA/transferrin family substrate-binding protein [Methyloversatilis discipulorum]|uniref:PhnD/SsuA/transferrin family substrate-binding protein n=1 Tax=Methyloversatilis discipulorum TaxID=1119528 RepID=UPI001A5E9783|nr:PhnD/SsuA/transferrin family substrate-binding protein [Methyloversatilis discipulorum]MBL8468428.1 phosphate/phosphite/phosphonate ABC transporter substrate-binding protein [Methyloversatilis discipulorum]